MIYGYNFERELRFHDSTNIEWLIETNSDLCKDGQVFKSSEELKKLVGANILGFQTTISQINIFNLLGGNK